jgi:hypothetical protein
VNTETIAHSLGGARRYGVEWVCKCPAHSDRSPSLNLRDTSDGKILAICRAGCLQDAVLAELRARGLWPEPERNTWSTAERRAYAKRRRDLERDLPSARQWRRAAEAMAQADLAAEKGKLFDPTSGPADTDLIERYTAFLRRLRAHGDAGLVEAYHTFRSESSKLAAALVRWSGQAEHAEHEAFQKFFAKEATR